MALECQSLKLEHPFLFEHQQAPDGEENHHGPAKMIGFFFFTPALKKEIQEEREYEEHEHQVGPGRTRGKVEAEERKLVHA